MSSTDHPPRENDHPLLRLGLSVLAVALIIVASFLSGVIITTIVDRGQVSAHAIAAPDEPSEFGVFWEAWGFINRSFYYRDRLDARKMTYGAIRGVIEALQDPFTSFIDPQNSETDRSLFQGSFEGIGANVGTLEDGRPVIINPLAGSPAEAAGLLAGDIILKVDDTDTAGIELAQVVALVKGPRGTTVRLTIERASEAQPLVISVTRAEIKTTSVSSELITPDLGYIRIIRFTERSTEEMQAALKDLKSKGAKGYVLDLRNNPGGLVETSVGVASQFVGSGPIFLEHRADGTEIPHNAMSGGIALGAPAILLINEGSASGAELVAGAMQDNGYLLVGQKSYGKGSVQEVRDLSDGSSLHITIAEWLTPKARRIHGKGLTPDFEVAITDEDRKAERDPQLDRAIKELSAILTRGAASTETSPPHALAA